MKILILLIALFLCPLFGKTLKNPDNNTLWMEDFKDFKTVDNLASAYWKGNIWYGKDIECEEQEKGTSFTPTGKQGELKTMIPLNKEYPWLVIDIAKVSLSNGYNSVAFGYFKGSADIIGATREITPAVFLAKIFNDTTKSGTASMTTYMYGAALTLNSMKLQRKPDALPEIIQEKAAVPGELNKGDRIIFRVTTARKVKDISLQFHDSKGRPVFLNGKSNLQLLPPGDDDCIWEAAVDVESLVLPDKKAAWQTKALILGGQFRKPYIFNVNLKKGTNK